MRRISKFGVFAPAWWYSAVQSSVQPRPLSGLVLQEAAYSSSSTQCNSGVLGDRAGLGLSSLLKRQFDASFHLKNKNLVQTRGINILSGCRTGELVTLSMSQHNPIGLLRTLATSSASKTSRKTAEEERRKEITTVEDPFAPTYNIPDKPLTFTEGASYGAVILVGLGIAGVAAYAVITELVFQPKEYKVFNKALERVQNESQVTSRIGFPIKGYGQESRNRSARRRIPNRVWTDDDGVEHVEVNFHIRGPHGTGVVYSEMFKDKVDKKWKYTYLMVEIRSPSPKQLLLESYVPA